MLRSMRKLRGYNIRTTDGEIGKAYGFLFDDKLWLVRYLVVKIGSWFSNRQVIISPSVLDKPDMANRKLPVLLIKEELINSQSIDSDKPVSQQREEELSKRIEWPVYSMYGEYGIGAIIMTEQKAEEGSDDENSDEEKKADSHLRNTREVIGYHIQATDGSIGNVSDFIVDDKTWTIKYIVVNTREWLPGRKVLILPDRVKSIKWSESKVYVELSKKTIRESPGFDPSSPIDGKYEERLYDYYRRPNYSA